MNIMHLKYATEIAKTGSLNKAAENLYMGQPNLSRAIKELETNLGITIFQRSAKGMVPTPDGEQFLQYAKKILQQIDEVEALYQKGPSKKQQFSISVPRASYISEAFTQFSKTISPGQQTELFYKETNALRAIKNILQSDYRLGIIRYAKHYEKYFEDMLAEKELVAETVSEFVYTLLMSRHHALAEKAQIGFSDLVPYVEIAHADPFVPSLSLAAIKKEEQPDNIERRIFVFERGSQFELLSENPETFMWVSPVPQKLLDRYNLIERDCPENKRVYRDVLIYKKDYRLTPLDKRFIEELKHARENYLKKNLPLNRI